MANTSLFTVPNTRHSDLKHISTIPGFTNKTPEMVQKKKKKTLSQNDKTVRCKQNYIFYTINTYTLNGR